MDQIIQSALDDDLYKFSMQQAVLHNYPDVDVKYRFKCRTKGVDLRPFRAEIQQQVNSLEGITFTDDDLSYMDAQPWTKTSYIDSLRSFKFDPRYVTLGEDSDQLTVEIAGNWYKTILFEVKLLGIIIEVYTKNTYGFTSERIDEGLRILREKMEYLKTELAQINCPDACAPYQLTEMGTRRRFSRTWQDMAVRELSENLGDILIGTSNVFLARKYNLRAIGTMAHEWLQAHQALAPLKDFQTVALEKWMHEYRGWLGIALSDVVGVESFLRAFDMLLAKAYDGTRQDSGDPIAYGWKMKQHYDDMWIDSRSKTAVFSDGLDFPSSINIYREFCNIFRIFFGIGTYLSNDMGVPSLSIVIKMVECCGRPVAKLSDSPGKEMCDNQTYLAYLRQETQYI